MTACDGVRRRRLLRRLTRHKITSRYTTLTAEGAPGPPEASDVRADDGGGPCAVSDWAEAAAGGTGRADKLAGGGRRRRHPTGEVKRKLHQHASCLMRLRRTKT